MAYRHESGGVVVVVVVPLHGRVACENLTLILLQLKSTVNGIQA